METIDFNIRDLHDNDWIGIVVYNEDPIFAGRCKINVFGLNDGIPYEHLPWAVPINSTVFGSNGAGSISIPKKGTIVKVQFNNGDRNAPEYSTIQNIDPDLIKKLKEDYIGTHVLLYDSDEELSVIYQKSTGLEIFYKDSFININPDSMITIQHANADSVIQLQGDKCSIVTKNEINISAAARVELNADEVLLNGKQTTKVGPDTKYYRAVNGEILVAVLSALAKQMDLKYPISPGVASSIVDSAKQSLLSQNVLISE